MKVHIGAKFLLKLDELKSLAHKNEDTLSANNYCKIQHLASVLPNTVYDNFGVSNDILKRIQSDLTDKTKTLKFGEKLIFSEMKKLGSLIQGGNVTIDGLSDYYFFDEERKSKLISKEVGIISKDITDTTFFGESYSPLNKNLKSNRGIKSSVHPCNAMIVIDPYILKNSKKLDNLIEFISYYKSSIKTQFHLTIFSSSSFWNPTTKKMEEYVSEDEIRYFLRCLQDSMLEYSEICLLNQDRDFIEFNQGKEGDRFFYTNYSKITIGHPNDDDRNTYFTQNLYGSIFGSKEYLANQFQNHKDDLKKWLKIRRHIVSKHSIVKKLIWQTQPFTNRLFNNLD